MTYYTFDLYGRFAGVSDVATDRCTTVAPPELTADYNWSGLDWVYAPNIPTEPVVTHDATISIDDLCASIDREADRVRLVIVGDPVRVVEYQRAEAEATAYSAAGYTGTVPPTVQSWAEAKQWTAQQATDDILRASAAWNSALYALREIRLKGKEAVKAARDSANAQAAATAAENQIKAVLAQVQ